MLSNFHTHTILCDGKSTPEEVVLSALEKGFSSIGFSGHAPTDFDDSYCLKNVDEYIALTRSSSTITPPTEKNIIFLFIFDKFSVNCELY